MKVLGIMSGTSGDGVDVALCDITGAPPRLEAHILHGQTVPYAPTMRQRILSACNPQTSDVRALCLLNFDLADAFTEAITSLLKQHHIAPEDVDLIASHGQTVWHEVREGAVFATLQLGTSALLAERTGITTLADFRVRDVAAGGQGAPLTGYVDWLLLRHETRWRAVQNIGGMGNVTFLPPLSHTATDFIAFDTGAGNALIDAAVYELTGGKLTYDEDGRMAQSGDVKTEWVQWLLNDEFFKQPPPKTTGREKFGSARAQEIIKEGKEHGFSDNDIIASLTAFTTESIAMAYEQFSPSPIQEVIVGGGGKHNITLMNWLSQRLNTPVLTHEDIGIDSDYKEALVFAVLAYETWHNRPSTLPSQTGARHASVLGHIVPSGNYSKLIRETWG